MKYRVYFLGLLLLLSLPAQAQAQGSDERVQFGQDIVIETDETVGDAVCIFCSIRVRGTVRGDAVAVFGSLEIDGSVEGDAVAVGGNVRLGSGAEVGKDAVSVGGRLEIDGSVEGDAVAVGGNVRLGSSAEVGKDAVSVGGRLERDPQARVGGEATSTLGLAVGLGGLFLFGLLVCGMINLVLVLFSYLIAGEQRVAVVANTVRERTGLAALAGLGVLVAAVILFIISALLGPITPIMAIIVSVALFVTLVVGYTGLSFWLGRSLAAGSAPLVAVLLGALLITILQLIPFVCLITFPVFVLLALGSAAVSGYGTASDWLPRQFAPRPAVPPASPPPA